jgi:hypothetical protein
MVSSRIFRSRWAALFWAGGIIWTAYDVANATVPSDPKDNSSAALGVDATGNPVTNDDLSVLANAMGN